ncbi:MAG: DASH family cryptochrome [Oceanospirillaceae bacterium]|jgi:deoxyribodipyrimidine photo-lyase|nr:DASH family cryptochrome [Oceanospirillaceae bacterium]HAW16671.1 deoxyribodipyrimidine photolyase [Oceanospirillaceae bacterium]
MNQQIGLFLFSNDLRLDDNPALALAASEVDQLICLYCLDPKQPPSSLRAPSNLSAHRHQFLFASLNDLHNSLKQLDQGLMVANEPALDIIPQLITQHNIGHIYASENAGYYEKQLWQRLTKRYPFIKFKRLASHTLFTQSDLPFELTELPTSFSKFRKLVEPLSIQSPLPQLKSMPPSPIALIPPMPKSMAVSQTPLFEGGEQQGRLHLEGYFDSRLASHYKQTRNGLDGMDYSTKFSPWLANGSLSVRRVIDCLRQYERDIEANDSTYWIYFELLWREYYQWYAHHYGVHLFSAKGIKNSKPNTSFYPERFQKWCHGNTPYPIVNACMRQLRATGYMSNRGRQLVASCFVHELGLDWRYGAAYMEQQLVDYDVASNWGNWQYLAGVGADPRGHRRFDLAKQTQTYDPKQLFIKHWGADKNAPPLDSVDAADWPIVSP